MGYGIDMKSIKKTDNPQSFCCEHCSLMKRPNRIGYYMHTGESWDTGEIWERLTLSNQEPLKNPDKDSVYLLANQTPLNQALDGSYLLKRYTKSELDNYLVPRRNRNGASCYSCWFCDGSRIKRECHCKSCDGMGFVFGDLTTTSPFDTSSPVFGDLITKPEYKLNHFRNILYARNTKIADICIAGRGAIPYKIKFYKEKKMNVVESPEVFDFDFIQEEEKNYYFNTFASTTEDVSKTSVPYNYTWGVGSKLE